MSEAMAQDLWVLKDIGEEWEIERPATISDLVSAVEAYGVGEVLKDATIRDKRGNYRNGDFLVVRLEDT